MGHPATEAADPHCLSFLRYVLLLFQWCWQTRAVTPFICFIEKSGVRLKMEQLRLEHSLCSVTMAFTPNKRAEWIANGGNLCELSQISRLA